MRRVRPLLALAAAATTLALAPSASAAPVPDASCSVAPGATIMLGSGDLKLAQVFTPKQSGGLATAQFRLYASSLSTPGNWRIELAAAQAGLPGPVIASVTVPNVIPPDTITPVTASFPTLPQLKAGTPYALLVSRPGSNGFEAEEQGSNPCPGGDASYELTVGGPFIPLLAVDNSPVDLAYATTVEPVTGKRAAALKKCKKKKSKKARKKCRKRAKKLPL